MSTISDQKKRTLEALQQQYTAAKAKKLQDEQVKSQKKSNFNTPKPKLDAPRKGKGPEITPRQTYSQPSPHKGFVFFIILFYATSQGFVYQHFPSCCCFSGVAFSSSHCQQKPSASSGNLPTSLSMCAHVSSVWLCNYVTNTLNFVGQENKPVYAELSCAFHDNLSKDGVSVNIPLIWVLDIKFIVICYFTTSDIHYGELWFRIWMAKRLFTVLYMT